MATHHLLPSKPIQRDLLHTRAQTPCFLCGRDGFGTPWMYVALLQANRPAIVREVCARCAGDIRYAKPETRAKMVEERARGVFEEAA